jgi:hypothetical protein
VSNVAPLFVSDIRQPVSIILEFLTDWDTQKGGGKWGNLSQAPATQGPRTDFILCLIFLIIYQTFCNRAL